MVENFSMKLWAMKVAKQSVLVIIAGLGAYYGDNVLFLSLVPLFTAVENYLKH